MKAIIILCIVLAAAGCSSFRPVKDNRRRFVLMAKSPPPAATSAKGIGIGRIEMPGYLKSTSIAIRNGSEVRFSHDFFWAESLDAAIQRTVVANLGFTNVFPSLWRRDQVQYEIHITLERFDLDEGGTATLKAFWRIATPGSSGTVDSALFETRKSGPRLAENPAAATASLSEALGEMSDAMRHKIEALQNRK